MVEGAHGAINSAKVAFRRAWSLAVIIDVDKEAAARVERRQMWPRKQNGDEPVSGVFLWLVLDRLKIPVTNSYLSNIWNCLRDNLGRRYSHMPFRYIHMPVFGAYTCPQIWLSTCLNRLFSMFASWHKTIANFKNSSRPTFLTITTFINTMEEDDKWNSFSDSNAGEREIQVALAAISFLPPLEANYNMFNQLLANCLY